MELGNVYLSGQKLNEAKREFAQAKDLEPNRPEGYYQLALTARLQGDALAKEEKKPEAEKAYKDALALIQTALSKDAKFTPALELKAEVEKALTPPPPAPVKTEPVTESQPIPAQAKSAPGIEAPTHPDAVKAAPVIESQTPPATNP